MENSEIRKAGDYVIKNGIHIGDKEIILGENMKDKDGNFYLVADYTSNELFGSYDNCLVSGNFIEIADIFTERLKEQVVKVKNEYEKISLPLAPVSPTLLTSINTVENLENSVIVIKPTVLRPEHRVSVKQIYLATGGNGTRDKSLGTVVFCTNLYNGNKTRFERYDVQGILKPENYPDWVKTSLEKLQHQSKTKAKSSKEVER